MLQVAALYTLLAFLADANIVDGNLGPGQAAALWGLLFATMLIMRAAARRLAGALVDEERCVILGNAEAAHWLNTKLQRCEGARVEVVGRVPLSAGDPSANGLPVLGDFESLVGVLGEHRVDRALIAPGRGMATTACSTRSGS